MPRLNRTIVNELEAPEKGEITLMDSAVRGFGVRVRSSGAKSYFVRYRLFGGRSETQQRMTLGQHPQVTPEDARKRARDALAKARLGEDPMGATRNRRQSMTVREMCEEWLSGPGKRTRKGLPKSEKSFKSDQARLKNHVIPIIGEVKLCELKRQHIERLRDTVSSGGSVLTRKRVKDLQGETWIRGGEGAAGRTVAGFSSVLGWAVEREYLDKNPALGVHKARERRCERFLSTDEILSLQATLTERESRSPKAVGILRLLLLTGCRLNEIAGLQWSEVNLEIRTICLRQGKTGTRIVYLSDPAVAELKKAEREAGSPYVFPAVQADNPGPYQGLKTLWKRIRLEAGLPDVRIHDLRHTFASTALAEGASLEMIAKLLGHTELRTTERYAHLAAHAVRDIANRVGGVVTGPTARAQRL